MRKPVKRVLIYRLGSLGDTVVALPCFHLIERAFPAADRRLLTNFPVHAKAPPAAAIFGEAGLVTGYFRYAVGTRHPIELARLWWQLLRWRPDLLIYMGPARGLRSAQRDRTFFRMCGIRRMVGVPLTEELQCNLPLAGPPGSGDSFQQHEAQQHEAQQSEAQEYEAARLARTLAALGDARLDDPASWDLRLTPQEHDAAEAALRPAGGRPLIVASIGTKVQANEWGLENWQALLALLAAEFPDYALAITGATVDAPDSESLASAWRGGPAGPAINLCGRLTPRESAAVFARARVFLGHDSGPMHLAAAAQTPCVAVFSARGRPRKWFPYGAGHRVLYHRVECWGCNLNECIVERKKCILSITPEEVAAEVRAVLGTRTSAAVASDAPNPAKMR